jgi:imidazolonepropionase-like amidohydrolase
MITAGRLLRGPAGDVVTGGAVLVVRGVIAAAGPRAEVAAAAGPEVRTLDFPASTILPGLVNGHAHLTMDGGADPVASLMSADRTQLADRTARHAAQLLDCGVTTVRDLGDRDGLSVLLRDAIASGALPGPRVLAAVAPLTPPRGHCWFFGGEVADEPAMLAMVRQNAERGADVVKVMASGGHITPGSARMWESQFTAGELAAIVAEARALGLPVAAHAHGVESAERAISAGVSTIEHCTMLTAENRAELPPAVAEAMAERGIAACCTVGSDDWRREIATRGEHGARALYSRLPWLDRHGVTLVPGTDGGVHNARFDDFAGALELYEWLGFPAAQVVEMATVRAAAALDIDDVTGSITPGLAADLLVVDGKPDHTLAALRAVRLVVAAGRVHRPGSAAAQEKSGSAILARFTSETWG